MNAPKLLINLHRVPLRILHFRQCNISKQESSDLINALTTMSYINVIDAEIAECKCTITKPSAFDFVTDSEPFLDRQQQCGISGARLRRTL